MFHAFPSFLQGGFFGVDIFFVISGFLISGIIFRGLLSDSFSYRSFYAKRIRRILPNLTLLLPVVAIVGWACLFAPELKNLGRHIFSSAAFFQNFRLLSEVGYFTEDALRKPLLHLWSLAIEEQFYIVFPIVCALIWRFWKSKTLLFVASVLITAFSLIACLVISNKTFAFYFPLTRFWELGAGIVLAAIETFGFYDFKRLSSSCRNGLSVIGFILIVFAMTAFRPSHFGHPGYFTLLPVVGSVFLIAAQNDSIINRVFLSWRPIVFIGLISYSLYLWHWPILSFLYICEPTVPRWATFAALVLSFVIATLVYFHVEEPARRCKCWSHIVAISLLLLLVAEMGLGLAVEHRNWYPHRTPKFSSYTTAIQKVREVRAVGEWDGYSRAKSFQFEGVRIPTPTPEDFPTILFAGDSHMAQYYERAEFLANKTHTPIGFVCRAARLIFSKEASKKDAAAFYKLIEDKRIKKLVITQQWARYSNKELEKSMRDFREALKRRPDLKLYVLLDYPWTEAFNGHQGDTDPLRHVPRWRNVDQIIVPYPKSDRWKRGNEVVLKGLNTYAEFINPTEYICPGEKCNLLKWYKDDDHLQAKSLLREAVWLDTVFN